MQKTELRVHANLRALMCVCVILSGMARIACLRFRLQLEQTILLSTKMMLGSLQQLSDKVGALEKMVDPYGASTASRMHRSRMEVSVA